MCSRAYESDLTDNEWETIAHLIPPPKFGGRPREWNERDLVNGILYLVRTGCQWRQLPLDFPPWQTVYRYFRDWSKDGTVREIQQYLYEFARIVDGRDPSPTVICVDAQSVKTGKAGGDRGFDGGKRVKGRKRHIVTDAQGLFVDAYITSANVHDKVGGKRALMRCKEWLRNLPMKIYVDGGYSGKPFENWVRRTIGAVVEISENLAQKFKRFIPAPTRWVVERTFAWFSNYRRLDKDHERLKSRSLAMIRWAMVAFLVRRVTG